MAEKNIFEDNGLYQGRLISGSKSGYRNRYPDHDILFNANIFIPSKGKVWYGDLDITLDAPVLQKICNEYNEEMIIVPEMLGRFGTENRSYDEISKDAYVKFNPNNNKYLLRIYSGLKSVEVDNVTIVTSNGIDWEEKQIKK